MPRPMAGTGAIATEVIVIARADATCLDADGSDLRKAGDLAGAGMYGRTIQVIEHGANRGRPGATVIGGFPPDLTDRRFG